MKNRQVSQRIFLGSQETKQINGRGRRSSSSIMLRFPRGFQAGNRVTRSFATVGNMM